MARSSVWRNSELSTSRISRLLRPLRTKCIALATLPPYVTTSTYGSKACSVEFNPLDILPPPDSVRSYHVDHRSVASLRAALYAVRDCFREIVIKTKPVEASGTEQRVPRLADLCSTIVGENMEGEEDLTAGAEEDSEQLAEMENIYEIIPVQYRRSALLAHSLDIILHFPHHFTLLSILLDVSLQHDLYHESSVLLHWLLQAAVSPTSEVVSALRLCHPAHSSYLADLCQKWTQAGRPSSVFIRIVTTTLAKAARSELWSCKALVKFTRELHHQDFHSLMYMASQLLDSVADEERNGNAPPMHRIFGTKQSSLADQLNRWLNYSSSFPPFQDMAFVLDFLEQCHQSGVHQNTSESLAATVACWATHYLSVVTPSVDTHASIYRLLKDISPTVTMYNLLVEQSFGIKQTTAVKLQDSRVILRGYARCLRAKGLLLLEASLWACALRFVETSTDLLGPCGSRKEVRQYRGELMDLVDDAERRCFGSGVRSVGSSPCQFGWEWEETMRCWVQRDLPTPKKVKRHHELEMRPAQRSNRVSAMPPGPCTAIPLVSLHNHRPDDHDYNYADTLSSFELSFTSLISSALSNRTKLHSGQPVSGQLLSPTLTRHCTTPARTLPSPYYPSDDTIPTSDDALNLFAYQEI